MTTVQDLLQVKGTHVFTIVQDATVLDAAVLMNEKKIGCLVVADAGRVVGIFSERDVLTRVVAQRIDPAGARVDQMMTRNPVCCSVTTPVEEVRDLFKNRKVRHLPIIDDAGRLLGLVSIGDLNAWNSQTQERNLQHLQDYIQGRA